MTFLDEKFLGNSVEDWGIALAIILGAFIATKIAYWIIANVVKKLTKKTKTNLDDVLIETLEKRNLTWLILFLLMTRLS